MESRVVESIHNKSSVNLLAIFTFVVVSIVFLQSQIRVAEMEVEANPNTVSSNNIVCKESPELGRINTAKSETAASRLRKRPSALSLRLDGGKSSLKRFLRKLHDALQFFHDKIKLAHQEFSDTDDDTDDEYSDSQILFLEDVFQNSDVNNDTDYDDMNFGCLDSHIIEAAHSAASPLNVRSTHREFVDTIDYSKYPTLKTNNDEDYLDGQLLWDERRKIWNQKLPSTKQSIDSTHKVRTSVEKSGTDSHSSMDDNNTNDQPKDSSTTNSSFSDSNHNISAQKFQIPAKKYHIFYKCFILQSKRLKHPIGLDQLAPVIQNEWKYIDEIGTQAARSKTGSTRDNKKWKSGQYPVNYSRSIYGRG